MSYTPGLNGGRINVTLAGNSTSAGGGYALASTGTVTLAGGNNITLSQNGNAVTISAFTQTVQTQSRFNMTLSGNTAGAMAQVSSGTLTLAGGNNITLSQAGNAVTISGGAGGGFTAGMSTGGNTSGTTGTVTNQMIFAGGNNITLSQSTGAGGNTISISAPNIATASAPFAQQLAGNSTSAGAGYSTVTSGTMQWAGGNNVTLSQDGQSVTISAGDGGGGNVDLDYYQNMDRGTSASLATAHRTLMLQRLNQENNAFGHNITANTFLINMTANMTATSLSSSHSVSMSIGVYLDQTTRLSLVNSASTSWGFTAATDNTKYYHGPRWVSFVSSQWSSPPNFSSGNDYVFGLIANSSNYGPPLSYIGQNYMHSLQRSGTIGTTVATNTSMAQGNYWNAMYSATQSSLPSTIASNVVNRNNATAIFMPHVILNNRYSGTF